VKQCIEIDDNTWL